MSRNAAGMAGTALTAVIGLVLIFGVGLAALAGSDLWSTGGIRSGAVPAQLVPWYLQAAGQCSGLSPAFLAAQGYTESGFNTYAVSDKGAAGVAQFTPATWSAYGRNDDGSGNVTPFNPANAIMAQARMMCDLLEKAQRSGIPGDPLVLALAGYNAGWDAVETYRGVPPYPKTQNYVATVTRLAREWTISVGFFGGPGGAFHDGARLIALPRPNLRSPQNAILWARTATAGSAQWYRRCLAFTATAYGWNHSGQDTALIAWQTMPVQYKRPGDRNPPPGALLFWDTGQPAGHVSLYLGGGTIASNDIVRRGGIDVVPASAIEQRWGARYLGWSAPYFPHAG